MQDFVIGQRWISAAELHLGLGMVIEIEHRTVSIIFPATGETRIYARADAPLTRVRFREGDWVEKHDGENLQVLGLSESNGLIVYHCADERGNAADLPEGRLSNFLQPNQPAERLLNAQDQRNRQQPAAVRRVRAGRQPHQPDRAPVVYRARSIAPLCSTRSAGG